MGLKDRLKRLQRTAERDTMTLVCPACDEEFRVHVDTSLDYLALEWPEETGAKSHREMPPDVLRLAAHAHDPSLFVDKADGTPWLGLFFHGISQMPEDVEDLSEP